MDSTGNELVHKKKTCFSFVLPIENELISIFSILIMRLFDDLQKLPFFLDFAFFKQYVTLPIPVAVSAVDSGFRGGRLVHLLTTRILPFLQQLQRVTMINHQFYWIESCSPFCTRSGKWAVGSSLGRALTIYLI